MAGATLRGEMVVNDVVTVVMEGLRGWRYTSPLAHTLEIAADTSLTESKEL